MSLFVVWVDLKTAKLFHLSEDRMERETLEAHPNDAHDGPALYDKIAGKMAVAKKVLILGPGIARTHLHNRLKDGFPELARKVVGCENSDHSSDHQIAAYATKYFHKPVA